MIRSAVRLALLCVLIGAPTWAAAQARAVTGTIAAAEGAVTISTALDAGGVGLQLTGTWTGTIQFEATLDGATWVSLQATPTGGLVPVTSATGNGVWQTPAGGTGRVRARASAWTSGTATVSLISGGGTVKGGAVVGTAADDSANATTKLPVLPCRANTVPQVWTEAAQVPCSVDLAGAARVSAGGPAAHADPVTGNPVVIGGAAEADAAALDSTGVAEGDASRFKTDIEGRLLIRVDHPNRFSATLINSTATTLTEIRAAPGAGLSLYVTDIQATASVASTATADQQLTLKTGTGTSCGTGTATVFSAFNAANAGVTASLRTPIKVPANTALCFIHAATGSKSVVVNGWIAP